MSWIDWKEPFEELGSIRMSWIDWKEPFEGLACSVRKEAGTVCPLEEDAPPVECTGGRVSAVLQERSPLSILLWAWGRRTVSVGAAAF